MQVLRAHLPRVFCLTLLAIGATSFVPTSGDEPRGEEADAQKGISKGVIFASTYDAEGEGVLNSAIRRGQKIPK